MPRKLYYDYARFGAILPDCATLLREFAGVLEAEGQFPAFDSFLAEGDVAWPNDLRQQFPAVSQWEGLDALRAQIQELFGAPAESTVLFSGTSRQLARIAFQCLLNECESVLCTDQDWPEFQQILRLQVAQAGALLRHTTFRHFVAPGAYVPPRDLTVAENLEKYQCDGMFLTSIAHDGLSILPTDIHAEMSTPEQIRFSVIDGSQHAGYRPIVLPSTFRGIVLGGTHKWLCSGVPLSFAVYIHGDDRASELRHLRKAVRASAYDDMLLLRTADLGLKPPNQTMRLEPLLAAQIAIKTTLKQDMGQVFQNRCRNAQAVHDLAHDLYTPLKGNPREGFGWFDCDVLSAPEVRMILHEHDLTVSALGEHQIRASMPGSLLNESELLAFEDAIAGLTPAYVSASTPCKSAD